MMNGSTWQQDSVDSGWFVAASRLAGVDRGNRSERGQGSPWAESTDLVLMLRDIHGNIGGLREDMREIKTRMTAVELGLAGVRREIAGLAESDAHLSARVDRLSDRIERIEKRLDLVLTAR
jgi:hypothetical protein